ncbi:MAG: riboflavin synthase [Bacteroidia bacterium]|nr:riboflavin synthase [Bacteroidia bacterium]MCO5253484.1 riboflavin synthase [Bacteroidota bacterium]
MFTGIIEDIGEVVAIEKEQSNLIFTIKSKLTPELKIDQSVAHNGVCLTVVDINGMQYKVTAIAETLSKTNLDTLKPGSLVNLERSLLANQRIDGHFVQGHVDTTGVCTEIVNKNGSWLFTIQYVADQTHFYTVSKGSICINGISLTVAQSNKGEMALAIIPYTYENTNLNTLKTGDKVNIEFDILGKYISALIQNK